MQRHPQCLVGKDGVPSLGIRDDGLIVPYPPQVRVNHPNIRPWWGAPDPTPEEIQSYVNGNAPISAQMAAAMDSGEIDVDTATKGQLIAYAIDEFGKSLPVNKDVETLRQIVKGMIAQPPRGQQGVGEQRAAIAG